MEGNEGCEVSGACVELEPWLAARVYAGRRDGGGQAPKGVKDDTIPG